MRKAYSPSHANRGAGLERLIDMTNRQYFNQGVADVRKIPTPVQITSNRAGKVTGYTTKGEWVDYVGVHNGKTIVFDAKETSIRTSFPLDNISEHQFQLLLSWHEQGAWAFLLVQFTRRDEVYLLPVGLLERYWEDARNGGRKSIPYTEFTLHCNLVKSEKGYVVHYLKYA